MKRVVIALAALLAAALLLSLLPRQWNANRAGQDRPGERVGTVTIDQHSNGATPTRLLGDVILSDYGSPDRDPEHDLTLMSRLMENSLVLLKSAANRPLSANEDWAALLTGSNAARERFLPNKHPALNAQGRLIDRWGNPLFFHAMGAGRFEIRSAGPDGTLWTADDVHRNADGSFRRGADLDPPSLF